MRQHCHVHHPRWDFWRAHPHWARWNYMRPYRWATWAAIAAWSPWGGTWGGGTYYDYGGTVVYEGDNVYVEGEQVATAEEYTQQAVALADAGAQAMETAPQQADESQWMSLGVFALADEDEGDPSMFLQLAVNKDGVIAGTYHNTLTEQTLTVQGSVDKQSQRAAWSIGDAEKTVMETGIYNLTQDETPVLIHFGDQQTQTWLMVRLEDPDAETTGG
ncbi:MAG: hypothetical protein ACYTG0_20730 [Planctomycetota bacterium]